MIGLVVLLSVLLGVQCQPCDGLWNYNNPNVDWPLLSCAQTCSGQVQSPVNIDSYVASSSLSALTFTGYGEAEVELENLGYTIEVLNFPSTYTASFVPGYNLAQFHFHTPAENTFSGVKDPVTMHCVHKNKANGGIKVVTILFEKVDSPDNAFLEPLVQALPLIPKKGNITTLTFGGLQDILDERHLAGHDSYVNFAGSLTTPPCTEGVDWYVFIETMKISTRQYNAFFNLEGLDSRPTQRNLTNVAAYIAKQSSATSNAVGLCVLLLAFLVALI
eukprot:TRINITY_DN1922_c0_g1_i2.p1 TRINITY_DN1922_c0_g1~~TRINITY_DN1922_c0_g1_i2.p1  ORF type:complete len:275 (+),score=16.66 TRINITY_DN1922_c0_g1_i2:80-904(+)